jgi:hypothetical protein
MPPGDRRGPWPLVAGEWMPRRVLFELLRLEQSSRNASNEDYAARLTRLLGRHPEISALASTWLERGDTVCRRLALQAVRLLGTPELKEAARRFVLGPWGTDADRMDQARWARAQGWMEGPTALLWQRGSQREVPLAWTTVNAEPRALHAADVQEMAQQAYALLQENKLAEAETLLRSALEREPDAPDLVQNLARAVTLQDRKEEGRDLVRSLFERHPDYLFARVSVARIAAEEQDFERAHELLDPLRERGELHVTELSSLYSALHDLALREGRPHTMMGVLGEWSALNPRDPVLAQLLQRLSASLEKQN